MPTGPPVSSRARSSNRRIALLSTYPPKLCGLATFAAALEGGLTRAGHRVDVLRIDEGHDPTPVSDPVVGVLVNGAAGSARAAAGLMSRADVAVIQHEYGIYGGSDGDEVLGLIAALDVPTVVVLHTVPLRPTPHQRSVLAAIGELGDRLVVMTDAARVRLLAGYPVDPAKVSTIPHGAAVPHTAPGGSDADADRDAVLRPRSHRPPQLLTWGLLGPGKGIEHAIDALSLLGDLPSTPRYTVAGVTHPKVLARDGDEYRRSLIRRSWATGVAGAVVFDDTYRDVDALTRFVASAAVVVLPYDSRDQVTSGVLVDAIAAGRPVIATAFPHAVELLGSGAGIVVPHGDPVSLAAAIRTVVCDPYVLASMAAEARRLAPSLSWDAVAGLYADLCDELVLSDERVAI